MDSSIYWDIGSILISLSAAIYAAFQASSARKAKNESISLLKKLRDTMDISNIQKEYKNVQEKMMKYNFDKSNSRLYGIALNQDTEILCKLQMILKQYSTILSKDNNKFDTFYVAYNEMVDVYNDSKNIEEMVKNGNKIFKHLNEYSAFLQDLLSSLEYSFK